MLLDRRSRTLVLSTLLTLGVSLAAPRADATPATRNVERFAVKVANSRLDAGAARVLVQAPAATARSVVTDYAKYSEIITRFKNARIVGRSGDDTDVYLEVPILNGAGKIWAIVRFSPPETRGNQEIVRGRLVKGNVKRLDATWRVETLDDKKSVLSLELLMVPDLPAPNSMISAELKKAAGRAVNAARNAAEKRQRASKR
jgi:ribosome-associated toxin RatA of RatAB toxin-antitoxin module